MSGGSFSYLYSQDTYSETNLREMAEDLRARGMYDAEEETLSLIPARASDELSLLWKAVEWHRSCDSSEAEVALAFAKYTEKKICDMNPPG